jgi:hypothetical protein
MRLPVDKGGPKLLRRLATLPNDRKKHRSLLVWILGSHYSSQLKAKV